MAALCYSSAAGRAAAQAGTDHPAGRHFDHVVVVMMENQRGSQVLSDPNLAALVKQSAWFSDYHAIAHPSLPNYLAIVAGTTFGLTADRAPKPLPGQSIVNRLEQKHLTWKSYAEDYPGSCYLKGDDAKSILTPKDPPPPHYTKAHVPLLSLAAIEGDARRCARIVNAHEFLRDASAGALPNFSFYSPNLIHDGHDTSVGASAVWLRQFLQWLERTAAMRQRTLVMIVWDEGEGDDARSNRALALLIGDMVTPGRYSTRLTHYSLLRTIEDNFGLLPVAGGDANATPVPEQMWH